MNREKHLETILVVVPGLFGVYALTGNRFFLFAAALLSGGGLASGVFAKIIHNVWMALAHAMGFVMSKLILAVVFFVFLFPIARLARLFSKADLLQLKKKQAGSYYTERKHVYVPADLENPW